MTVGHLKEILKNVPDNFVIGKKENYTVCENWYGTTVNSCNVKIDIKPIVDLDEGMLILNI